MAATKNKTTKRKISLSRDNKPMLFGWCMTNEHDKCRNFYLCGTSKEHKFCGCACHPESVNITDKEDYDG